MIKKMLYILGVAGVLLLSACGKEAQPAALTAVNVRVNDFELVCDDLSSASKSSASEAVTRLGIAIFDLGGNAVYTQNQNSTDDAASFGSFSCSLPAGSYVLAVVGHKCSADASIVSPALVTFPTGEVKDCFCDTAHLTLTGGTASLSMELRRAVACFRLTARAACPANVHHVDIAFSRGGSTLNPSTRLALSDLGRTGTVTVPSSFYGAVNSSVSAYVFLSSDEETMDVAVSARDASNAVLYAHAFTDVAMKRNRRVTATGDFYTSGGGAQGSFTFNTSWLEEGIAF